MYCACKFGQCVYASTKNNLLSNQLVVFFLDSRNATTASKPNNIATHDSIPSQNEQATLSKCYIFKPDMCRLVTGIYLISRN